MSIVYDVFTRFFFLFLLLSFLMYFSFFSHIYHFLFLLYIHIIMLYTFIFLSFFFFLFFYIKISCMFLCMMHSWYNVRISHICDTSDGYIAWYCLNYERRQSFRPQIWKLTFLILFFYLKFIEILNLYTKLLVF